MRHTLFSLAAVSLLCSACPKGTSGQAPAEPAAQAAKPTSQAATPVSFETVLREKHADAEILQTKVCELGADKIPARGVVFRSAGSGSESHPLRGAIAYQVEDRWQVEVLARGYEGENFGIFDFLSPFWTAGKFSEQYAIDCAKPGEGENLGPTITGRLEGPFAGRKVDELGKHLCFMADDVYNNWLCFNYDKQSRKIALSFSEIHAD